MTYDDYKSFNGQMSEGDFSSLFPYVHEFLQSYAESYISTAKLATTLEDYGEFNKALTYQADFIHVNGGVKVFYGESDMDIESVTSSGYTFKVGEGISKYNGIPLSPLAKSLVLRELRQNGFLSRVIT